MNADPRRAFDKPTSFEPGLSASTQRTPADAQLPRQLRILTGAVPD